MFLEDIIIVASQLKTFHTYSTRVGYGVPFLSPLTLWLLEETRSSPQQLRENLSHGTHDGLELRRRKIAESYVLSVQTLYVWTTTTVFIVKWNVRSAGKVVYLCAASRHRPQTFIVLYSVKAIFYLEIPRGM